MFERPQLFEYNMLQEILEDLRIVCKRDIFDPVDFVAIQELGGGSFWVLKAELEDGQYYMIEIFSKDMFSDDPVELGGCKQVIDGEIGIVQNMLYEIEIDLDYKGKGKDAVTLGHPYAFLAFLRDGEFRPEYIKMNAGEWKLVHVN